MGRSWVLRGFATSIAITVVAASCGSSDETGGSNSTSSTHNTSGVGGGTSTGSVGAAGSAGSTGAFNTDGGPCSTAITCAGAGANCGPLADGCGGIIQCGTCPSGQTCGGSGMSSVCGTPACTPKT